MMQDNRLWILMSRFLSGEATPAETDELHHMIAGAPDKQYLLEIFHSYFNNPLSDAGQTTSSDTDLDISFLGMVEKADLLAAASPLAAVPEIDEGDNLLPIVRSIPRRIFRYTAAAAIILVLSWGAFNLFHRAGSSQDPRQNKGEEVLAAAGTRTRLVLPDGTRVWLNSNSKLKYAQNFNQLSREVELEGEAYFDVIRDVQHPFIVHTSGIDVKVLGTSFAVKSYPQDETIETTLLKGSIEVSRQDKLNTPRVILKPNEKLVFNKNLATIPRATDPLARGKAPLTTTAPDLAVNSIPKNVPDSEKVETAWMYNRLVFNGDNFKEVAQKMERWYNVRIVFKDDQLYTYRFGGAFVNETVEEALRALQLTAAFAYKIRGSEVELYAK